MAKFAEVIECLKNGGTAQRIAWDVNGDKEIMMQIPQRIAKDIVKPKIGTVGSGEIEDHHQVLIIEFKDDGKTPARATYYIPTWEDIMADDWRMTQPADSYIARMVNEREELNDKAEKLNKFFSSPIFNGLPDNKKVLMERQYKLMAEYVEVLDERIKLENTAQG